MKKIFTALALAAAVTAASAVDLSASVKYDYDRGSNTPTWISEHIVTTGLKAGFGVFGAADVGFVATQLVTGTRTDQTGYDLGYSNGFSLGPVALSGRIGYRHIDVNNAVVTTSGNGFDAAAVVNGGINQTRYSVNATYALTPSVKAEVGAAHTSAIVSGNAAVAATNGQVVVVGVASGSLGGSANRYTVGANVALTKKLSAELLYARTRELGYNLNGLTTAVNYTF